MKAITFSFDDGHPLDMKVAERLAHHGLTGTFYVPVRNCEGKPVMEGRQLRSLLAAGFEIAGHTLDHRRLTSLDLPEARRQIVDGQKALEDLLGASVSGFAYPGGRAGTREQNLVREAGFAYARTTQMFRLDRGDCVYRLPTTLQFYPHGLPALLRNWLRQGAGWQRLELALTSWRQKNLSRTLECLLPRLMEGQVLHIWGHAWEIGDLTLWPVFEEMLGLVADAAIPCMTNGRVALGSTLPAGAAGMVT
jgi:peptidoglycan/xylan/chitin deacetylase (PgdA/CDA1 family)